MGSEGYVYCLTNVCMPDIVKIGMTMDDPEIRAAELSSVTGVPSPFQVAISKRIVNPREKEKALHELLSSLGFRVNNKREFFNCSLNIVGLLFAVIDGADVRITDAEAIPYVRKQNVQVEKLE
jgi:hypothetical protein